MSQARRSASVDLLYSEWHRSASLGRFLSKPHAFECAMIDIDDVEICAHCYQPLALIEVKDRRSRDKPWTVMRKLGEMAGIPAFRVVYDVVDGEVNADRDIGGFTVKNTEWEAEFGPAEYAAFLFVLRSSHLCPRRVREVPR